MQKDFSLDKLYKESTIELEFYYSIKHAGHFWSCKLSLIGEIFHLGVASVINKPLAIEKCFYNHLVSVWMLPQRHTCYSLTQLYAHACLPTIIARINTKFFEGVEGEGRREVGQSRFVYTRQCPLCMDCVRLGRCRSKTTVHADEREEEWAELNKTSTYTEKHHLEYRHAHGILEVRMLG